MIAHVLLNEVSNCSVTRWRDRMPEVHDPDGEPLYVMLRGPEKQTLLLMPGLVDPARAAALLVELFPATLIEDGTP